MHLKPKTSLTTSSWLSWPVLANVAVRSILPFVIHLLGRPLYQVESISRDDVLPLKKFLAEATPAEIKTILGWEINSRSLLISLPMHKYIAWSRSITDLLAASRACHGPLETLIGRLNHPGFIIPCARHFVGHIRAAMYLASRKQSVILTADQRADLQLCKQFLKQASTGISLNLLTLRMPDIIIDTDSCEHGIGGMNITSRFLWRWEIPQQYQNRTSLNSLEFLASFVGVAMEFEHTTVPQESCILVGGDSTTATGWLRRSNFTSEASV
eukprot:scaffold241666_cov75-Attheya_sp.AAC.1